MELFYRTKGNPTNPPLIILHGLWGASDNWLQVADLLLDNFYIILPDLRNHGRSPHSAEMDYKSMSQDIATLIQKLHLTQKPFIIGHSMGGKALMTLLLQNPEVAPKAAILDIAPANYSWENDSIHQILSDFMLHFPLSAYSKRDEIHSQIRKTFSSETLCQILFKNIRKGNCGFEWKVNIQTIIENIPTLLSWPTSSTPKRIPPLLFIRGDRSDYITDKEEQTIRQLFPTAEIATLKNASHFLHIEQPTGLTDMLKQFFSSL